MQENELTSLLSDEIIKSVYIFPENIRIRLSRIQNKISGREKKIVDKILENIEIAEKNKVPICQDTGIFEIWFFVKKNGIFNNMDIKGLCENAVSRAYETGLIRNSMDELQPVIHLIPSENGKEEIVITARGFGSENHTALHMLNPETSMENIKNCIIEDIKKSVGNTCGPLIIGIGLGGTAAKAVEMSALALAEMDFKHDDEENTLLEDINRTGYGPDGSGGNFTAIGVKIKKFPKHIAGMAMSVHIGCWCNRVRRIAVEIP